MVPPGPVIWPVAAASGSVQITPTFREKAMLPVPVAVVPGVTLPKLSGVDAPKANTVAMSAEAVMDPVCCAWAMDGSAMKATAARTRRVFFMMGLGRREESDARERLSIRNRRWQIASRRAATRRAVRQGSRHGRARLH